MSEKSLGTLKCNCKFLYQSPDPATGTYGEPTHFFKGQLSIVECDKRTIDEFCKIIVLEFMRLLVSRFSSSENTPRNLEYYGDVNNYK